MTEFNVPEKELGGIFPKISFAEILAPVGVQSKIFGDVSKAPYNNEEQLRMPSRKVVNGLFYHTEQGNGGGFFVVYDRSQSRVYFEYNGH